jgi:hypothetical protein
VPANRTVVMLVTLLMVSPVRADESPDIEMLEYLGNWETANGKYIDPQALQTEDVADSTQQKKVDDEK